jgi:hypothetical protein
MCHVSADTVSEVDVGKKQEQKETGSAKPV